MIAFDLHGFGKSDRPAFEFNEFESSMNFFTIPLLNVIKLKNLKNLIVIGHSYSGFIAAHLAPLIKDRLLGVWLVCPAGFTHKKFNEFEKKVIYQKFGKKYKLGPDIMKLVAYLTFDKVCKRFINESKNYIWFQKNQFKV